MNSFASSRLLENSRVYIYTVLLLSYMMSCFIKMFDDVLWQQSECRKYLIFILLPLKKSVIVTKDSCLYTLSDTDSIFINGTTVVLGHPRSPHKVCYPWCWLTASHRTHQSFVCILGNVNWHFLTPGCSILWYPGLLIYLCLLKSFSSTHCMTSV